MSIDLKNILTEEGWKAVAPDCKGKDKELLRALLFYWSLEDDDFDFRCKALTKVAALAATLKSAKEVTCDPDAVKYLAAMIGTAKSKQGELMKAKAEAAKVAAVAQKKTEAEEAHGAGDDEDEDKESDSFVKLKKALQSLKTSKVPYYFLYCKDKPYGLVVSKKDISKSSQHRKELSQIAGGSTTPPTCGQCRRDGNKLIIEAAKAPSGMRRILERWLKDSVPLGLKVVMADGSDEDDEEQPSAGAEAASTPGEPAGAKVPAAGEAAASEAAGAPKPGKPAGGPLSLGASVGRGGKNKPEDVTAVQEALNRRVNAGLKVDGKCGPGTIKAIEEFQKKLGQFKADGLIEPGRGTVRALAGTGKLPPPPAPPKPVAPPKLPKPTLAKAPMIWEGTLDILDTNIKELKKGILAQYGTEHSDLIKEIDENLVKLDGAVSKLDRRLSESLAKANAAKDDAARKTELKNSKAILADYIKFVKSEPLIAHIDDNPFGVPTNLKKIITDSLTHMAQAIG